MIFEWLGFVRLGNRIKESRVTGHLGESIT
jgi:hypothetical protein